VDHTNQWSHDPHDLDRAIELEQRSIALDNSNAFAYAIMSQLYNLTRHYDLGIEAAQRALAFDPNSAQGYASMTAALSYLGKSAEAVGAVHKAMRLDPRHQDLYSFYEGIAYQLMGGYEEAITPLKRFLARYPNIIPGHLILITCYVELGRKEEARAEAAEVMRINRNFLWQWRSKCLRRKNRCVTASMVTWPRRG
jgi:adenylate cyclase